MSLIIVTVVKDDLLGLRRTEASIRRQSQKAYWAIITPSGFSETKQHVTRLHKEGLVTAVLIDAGTGIYPAMNLAIQTFKASDWIWFLNAGDELCERDSFEFVMNCVSKTKVQWIYAGHKLGSSEGIVLGTISAPKHFKPQNQLFSRKYVSHQSTVVKNELLQKLGGFCEELAIAADWDLLVRVSRIDLGERLTREISIFYMGGLSTLSRSQGNRELLLLRRKHLGKRYVVKSYSWFYYREIRNRLVQSIEYTFPRFLDEVRKSRILLRTRFTLRR